MTRDLSAVAEILGASGPLDSVPISGWSIDSRTVSPGDLFFALRGPHQDGHAYVRPAMEHGAAGAVIDRPVADARNLLMVEDSLLALQSLASRVRGEWGRDVIGVTGSAGKTTTKDVIAQLLAVEFPVGKTIGNFNNHIGLPLSILRLPDGCRIAVLEIGMNHAGEIRSLAEIARPDVGVVTNVGYAHVENFESIEGVAAAKRELIESLPPSGVAVLNADDPLVLDFRILHPGRTVTFGLSESADVRADQLEFGAEHTRFRAGGVGFESPLAGRHGVLNVLAGIAVAELFGIAPARLRDAVRSLEPGKMRGERLMKDGVTILNDCYNSNPEAVRSMVDVLRATPAQRRIAVLGEMLELGRSGEALHREVGRYIADRGIDALIGIRGAARLMVEEAARAGVAAHFFESSPTAGQFVRQWVRPGDAVLFKGSRGVQVEKALERLLE